MNSSTRKQKLKSSMGFELSTLALTSSTTQPPGKLTVLFFYNIQTCMYYMIILRKKMMSYKKIGEIILVSYNIPPLSTIL